ncbi:MAG: DUF5615 family PIN-like protein [Herpetosiphon sp.]|nr:DUF5615 family PIN-like protein [Herpetosiphon sp.]
MSKIKVYADEHVSWAIINGLRQRGVDILSVADAGLLGASDETHLTFAIRENRVMFTQDTDFLRIAAANTEHAGIVYTPQHTAIQRIIAGLLLITEILEAEEIAGKIEFL